MREADFWHWCEFYMEPHETETDDPYDEGPQYTSYDGALDFPPGAWTWHVNEHKGYQGQLWHFVCPGPHRKLWIGATNERR